MKRIPLGILVTAALALFAPLAAAQIVIVTSADGRIGELSRQQAEQLYLGRTRSLPDGTPVALVDLPAGRVRDRFYEQLTGKNPSQIRAYWSRMVFTGRALPPQQAENVRELGARLMTDPNLIGYLSAADADPHMKVLLKLP
ncbi:hypothetical protein [Aromatoleum bremense]|uniref:Phosphate ABC transporter substrate-binding protein n=1 Tax=Aromatoleum bremense TaxID=76115 RepID=A0ABX1NZ77_9RHOO|nr:hypothetical protein [Aromatoleum bremense]NMG17316.1 hypothetical protein [Aromatoleum bremense]QTQ32513.1 Uncharacterized protein pbN1_25240 [Aromatoleum bremense]